VFFLFRNYLPPWLSEHTLIRQPPQTPSQEEVHEKREHLANMKQ
jgi:hypothetical protein